MPPSNPRVKTGKWRVAFRGKERTYTATTSGMAKRKMYKYLKLPEPSSKNEEQYLKETERMGWLYTEMTVVNIEPTVFRDGFKFTT